MTEKKASVRELFPIWFDKSISSQTNSGWLTLLIELGETIQQILAEEQVPEAEYQVYQVKEKHGGLRWYDNSSDLPLRPQKRILEAVKEAERRAWKTCEMCGAPGNQRGEGWWIKTLCKTCRDKRNQKEK